MTVLIKNPIKLLNLVVFFNNLLLLIYGYCDQCQPDNLVACHSENIFSLCNNGTPTHDYKTCPMGYVCTDKRIVCYPKTKYVGSCERNEIVQLETNKCGICNSPYQTFACIDETTVAFCLGDATPHLDALGFCPENTVCDLNNPLQFCSDRAKAVPSCKLPTNSTITINPITTTTQSSTSTVDGDDDVDDEYTIFCIENGITGNFKPINDTTCRKFITCIYAKKWIGILKECPTNQYFHPMVGHCKKTKVNSNCPDI